MMLLIVKKSSWCKSTEWCIMKRHFTVLLSCIMTSHCIVTHFDFSLLFVLYILWLVCSVDSIDQRDTQSRSLDDFSLLSPSLRRVVLGYRMIPEEYGGPTGAGSLPNSILSPHPSPTLDDMPTISMSQGSGESSSNHINQGDDRVQLASPLTALLTPKKGTRIIIDHVLAALLAVGVAIVLAAIILLLGPEQEHQGGSVSLAPVTGELGSWLYNASNSQLHDWCV